MQSFIELAWLESVIKSGELKVLRRSRICHFWSDFCMFLSLVKTRVFLIPKCGFWLRRIYNPFGKGVTPMESTATRLWKISYRQRLLSAIYSLASRAAPVFFGSFSEKMGGGRWRGGSIYKTKKLSKIRELWLEWERKKPGMLLLVVVARRGDFAVSTRKMTEEADFHD